jgi:predicted glutamine amidotransferase
MCRLVGWVSSSPVTGSEVLGDAAVARLLELSEVHCHGWGAAYFEDGRLVVRRSSLPAWQDEEFQSLLSSVRTTSAVLHLRMGTPGYGRRLVENHPFTDGRYAFAHNGAVLPPDRVDALLSASTCRTAEGTTDSERIFLGLLDELDTQSVGEGFASRVAGSIAVVVDRARQAGLHASSWNSMLLGPEGLAVICEHDPALVAKDVKLWPDAYPPKLAGWPPYFDLRLRDRGDGIRVVASSGTVDDVSEWKLLANHSVLALAPDRVELVEIPGRRKVTLLAT